MSTDRAGTAPSSTVLSGAEVVLLRSPDRAAPMAAELRARGARVQLLPMIDFQLPGDTGAVSARLQELGAGLFDWVVFTSATTVRALERFAGESGRTLAGLAAGTRIAAVGTGTRHALERRGISTDLLPGADQSARGLAAAWPAPAIGRNRILLPQADIADPFLRTALARAGWDVQAVTAYQTVDYPAPDGRRLEPEPPAPGTGTSIELPRLTPGSYRDFAARPESVPHAVVVTSPSTARRFVRDAMVPGTAVLAAIGEPTAAQLRALGCPPQATAAEPTPAGIADAVEAALAEPRMTYPTEPEGTTT